EHTTITTLRISTSPHHAADRVILCSRVVQRAVEEGRVVTRTAPDEHRAPSPQHRRRVAPVELRGAPRHRRPRVRLQVVPGSDWTAALAGTDQEVVPRPDAPTRCIGSAGRVHRAYRAPDLRVGIIERASNYIARILPATPNASSPYQHLRARPGSE